MVFERHINIIVSQLNFGLVGCFLPASLTVSCLVILEGDVLSNVLVDKVTEGTPPDLYC